MVRTFLRAFAGLNVSILAIHAGSAPEFEKDVLPILEKSCLGCHSPQAHTSGLDLSTVASMLKGGAKGAALVKGSAAQSLLYTRIVDKSMPFGPKKLSAQETALIRDWIEMGAPAKMAQPGAVLAKSDHWSFIPPTRPPIPEVRNKDWVRTPIDAFILAALERKGISPTTPAAPETLARRLYLDVLGLPPPPEERMRLREGRSSPAYSKLVNSLLDRPQYGERWARHWLDTVRYAESNGYERDGTKPHAWRYRDYVIDSLNKDKPFDRFVTEQVAGDEIEGTDSESQIATTLLRLGTWDDEPADPVLDRYDQLDDIVGTTSAAFLGLTLRCARCHDHKFEPFKQTDYYKFLAVFEPLKRPQDGRTELDRLVGTEPELASYREKTAKADTGAAKLNKEKKDIENIVLKRMFAAPRAQTDLSWMQHAETVLAFRTEQTKRSTRQKQLVEQFNQRLDREISTEASDTERATLVSLRDQIDKINATRPNEPPRAYVLYEDAAEAAPTHILRRGDATQPGAQVQPGVPEILPSLHIGHISPTAHTTGRRLWLAQWMTHPRNPLLARVIVNRVWQWHFGEGLVSTESDLGVAGQRPSNPELLDYLATELIQSGWSIKHIQRLILNSNTYRESSDWNQASAKVDPDDTLLWRWKPRRLEAEVVRDAMLSVTGELNLEMAGPSIYPKLPRAVLEGQSRPGENWGESDSRQAARRSIYIFSKRSLPVPELEVLDAPDTTSSCEQRDVSTTGPQALTFLNGDFTRDRAIHLARRIQGEAAVDRSEQVARAFAISLGRPPTHDEIRTAVDFLVAQEKQIELDRSGLTPGKTDPRELALEAFCLVMLNSNEFFYLE